MDIYIKDKNLKTIGIIDSYSSVIWANRYFDVGDFELYIPATNQVFDLMSIDNFVFRMDDDMMCIIEGHELMTDVENGDYISITGRDLRSILDRRIVWKQTLLSGTAEDCIRKLVDENCINPIIPARKIDKLILGKRHGFTEKMQMQVTGDNLLEVITKLCKEYAYGFKITFDGTNFVFDLYKGTDRSYGQMTNPWVTFSPEFENIYTSKYKFSNDNYKNIALVAGEGEGLDRKTSSVYYGTEPSGLARRELFVDARNVSTNNGSVALPEYNAMLNQKGLEELGEHLVTEDFDGKIDHNQVYHYKKDYFLGDVVNITNEYGISAAPRILEIIESEDENEYSIMPSFSKWKTDSIAGTM